MTKSEHIAKVLESVGGYTTAEEKRLFDYLYGIISGYVDRFMPTTVASAPTALEDDTYVALSAVTAKLFNEKYFDNEKTYLITVDSLPTKDIKPFPYHYLQNGSFFIFNGAELKDVTTTIDYYRRQFMKDFLGEKCVCYKSDGSTRKGFDRQAAIVKIESERMVFIEPRLWNWYRFHQLLNIGEFVRWLDKTNQTLNVFDKMFSSVEKDKQHKDGVSATAEARRKASELSNYFERHKGDGPATSTISSISNYLTSWFDIGYNSPVVFGSIDNRLKTVSKYCERYFRYSIGDKDVYSRFNGFDFDVLSSSYCIKGDSVEKYISYRSTVVNTSGGGGMFSIPLAAGNFVVPSGSPNYGQLGSVSGDTVVYYGYAKASYMTSTTPPTGETGGADGIEYFIGTEDGSVDMLNESVNTFCSCVMSAGTEGETSTRRMYDMFVDFLSSSYLDATTLSTEGNPPVSAYLDCVYAALSAEIPT